MSSFAIGGSLPALTILLPEPERFYITAITVAVALALTGYVSAKLSRANTNRAMLRNVLGGVFAMGVTLLVGHLVGTAV
jgi:VIT1/CCC1 family predicted Fe2+/Mn2+ transporter